MTDIIPSGINVIRDIEDGTLIGNTGNGIGVSWVNTNEKAVVNSSVLSKLPIS